MAADRTPCTARVTEQLTVTGRTGRTDIETDRLLNCNR